MNFAKERQINTPLYTIPEDSLVLTLEPSSPEQKCCTENPPRLHNMVQYPRFLSEGCKSLPKEDEIRDEKLTTRVVNSLCSGPPNGVRPSATSLVTTSCFLRTLAISNPKGSQNVREVPVCDQEGGIVRTLLDETRNPDDIFDSSYYLMSDHLW